MKKSSTIARKRSRNFSEGKLPIGLGLGDVRVGIACWMSEGEVAPERKLGATRKAMKESGMHSPSSTNTPRA